MPRKQNVRQYPNNHKNPPKGEQMTTPGQASSIRDIISAHMSGYPLPTGRQPINLNVDLTEITEDQFDFPDIEKFAYMDPVDQQQTMENLNTFVNHVTTEFNKLKQDYEAQTDADPTNDPVPDAN
jgi:hypothetical protein